MVVKYNANVQVNPRLELSNALRLDFNLLSALFLSRVFDKKETGLLNTNDIVKILSENGEDPISEEEVQGFLEMIKLPR